MGFEYSDGRRAEEAITALLRRAPRVGAGDRIAEAEARQSWPVRYHLAAERANLLRHLDFDGLDVLELGAGMGGVSRFLAESARHLTVVEGSSRRFAGLAERLRDLDNWSGWLGRIEEYDGAGQFDVVCLVGVLEYAETLVEVPGDFAGDAFDYLLHRARRCLRDDGVLLLAIENPLGLKYWSGAAEDHAGTLFDGIVGYGEGSVARTFARRELEQRFDRAGMTRFEEYLPFPDYKLPTAVIRPELAELDPDLAADLACFQPFADHQQRRSFLFPDYLALHHLAQAGYFADFANSFLLLAGPGGRRVVDRLVHPPGSVVEDRLAWHYSPRRRQMVETHFGRGEGGLWVEKSCPRGPDGGESPSPGIVTGGEGELRLGWADPGRHSVARGERLRIRLLRSLYFDRAIAFENDLLDFLRWALETYDAGDGRVAGEGIDALVRNAVCREGGYELFDLEWRVDEAFGPSWFVLRNVLALVTDLPFLGGVDGVGCLADLYHRLCARLSLTPDLASDRRLESLFQSVVSGRSAAEVSDDLGTILELRLAEHRMLPRDPQFLLHWRGLSEALGARDDAIRWLGGVRSHLEATLVSRDQAIAWLEKERAHESAKLHGHLGELHQQLTETRERLRIAERRSSPWSALGRRIALFFTGKRPSTSIDS